MPPAGSGHRHRAVRLLEAFFAHDSSSARRAVFDHAFADTQPDPRRHIQFESPLAVFAAQAADTLLTFGCATRGRHYLSLLLAVMSAVRGRQSDPDFDDLPRELDALHCSLPTRKEEHQHLSRLIAESECLARLYSPLEATMARLAARGLAKRNATSVLDPWEGNPHLEQLRHRVRQPLHGTRDEQEEPALAAPEPNGEKRDPSPDILAAFDDVPRAALLGAPGSGKSTTLRRLAVSLATRAQHDQSAPIPLLILLRGWTGDEALADFIAAQVPEVGWAAPALSGRQRLVLLLDGLNEVPSARRSAKAKQVLDFITRLSPKTPFVVSCRQDDYRNELDLSLDTLTLEPLSPPRIRAAVRQWFAAAGSPVETADRFFWQLAGDEGLARVFKRWQAAGVDEATFWRATDPQDHQEAYRKTTSEEDNLFRRHIPNPRSLIRLAANPFMLTMLFQVWAEKESLPPNRGDLFAGFIDCLLARERLGHDDSRRLTDGLAELAWRMQRDFRNGSPAEGSDHGVLTSVPRAIALESLGGDAGLLKFALDGTLLEDNAGELHFRHQLLQEYFSAQALRNHLAGTGAAELWPPDRWWRRSGWEETAVLLAGLYTRDCSPVVRWLATAQPEVAAQCIAESGADLADRAGLLAELQAAWLPRLTDEPQPEARASVGRALGRLNLDCRPGVGLDSVGLPDIDWVEIPAGEFVFQRDERRSLPRFHIARYPITNAQFQAFVDAEDGYRQDRWWRGLTGPDREPRPPRWSDPNHPRESVSWQEAVAFCAWLEHELGSDVRLPTEWEWERAAGGVAGRAFPWGNEYRPGCANINETWGDAGPHYLERTSPVGIYRLGATPEGVMDLSGNVWEWCLNEYAKPDRVQLSGTALRVLRGGSWGYRQVYARAVYRVYDRPHGRYDDIGFRVVCSVPIR